MGERPQTPDEFVRHMAQVTALIADHALDASLEGFLSRAFPADGAWFAATLAWCRSGVEQGWLCGREAGGIKFGRALAADAATHGFSIDVVEMAEVVGPHHVHPQGEIDLIMPLDATARFDGRGAGWLVYGPASDHRPTVTGGSALVLYLLPGGAIEFT